MFFDRRTLSRILINLLVLLIFYFCGCAGKKYVDARRILADMTKSKANLVQFQKTIEDDYAQKKDIYNQLLQFGAKAKKKPYPQLDHILHKMGQGIDAYKVDIGKVHRSIYLLKKGLTEWGREKIHEGDEEWKVVNNYRKNIKTIRGGKNRLNKKYKRLSREYIKLTKKYHIVVVEMTTLRPEILALFKAMILEVTNSIDLVRNTLYTASMMSSDKRIMNKKSIKFVGKLNKAFRRQKSRLLKLKAQFKSEAADFENMPVAPHMTSYLIRSKLGKIQAKIGEIKKKYNMEVSSMFGG